MATATKEKARKPTASKKSRATTPSIEFTVMAPEAKEVFLVGDFNGWQAEGFQMRKFKDGVCRKKVQLKPGRYEYLFLVDGNWWTDPKNDARCTNPFGMENSIIQINS
ncbi:MAG: isoamylase early set domain-containing protein [Desulfurivibrionaceae bacterium]|jgi:1,4-alpha-glucan branching enzyme